MTEMADRQFIDMTQELLDCITAGDWTTYQRLCDPTLSAFEPEARGHMVVGMDFHRFYFDLQSKESPAQTSIIAPHVRRLGDDVTVVSYIRLIQHVSESNLPKTSCFEETRVWQCQDGQWRNVHFHRSGS